MPFTLAHPAAVLPLIGKNGKYFSATGLIAGSIIPDFEYFLRLSSRSEVCHTVHGIFIVDVPAALLLSVAFHWWIKQPLIANMPWTLQKYFGHVLSYNWFNYFRTHFTVVVVSCLIGALTHVAWDSVSHTTGQLVQRIEMLQTSIVFNGLTIYRIIWWLSSLIGIAFVLLALKKNISTETQEHKGYTNYWPLVYLGMVLILSINTIVFIRPHYYRDFFTALLGSFILSVIFTSAICRLFKIY